jgi:hypothetical protein
VRRGQVSTTLATIVVDVYTSEKTRAIRCCGTTHHSASPRIGPVLVVADAAWHTKRVVDSRILLVAGERVKPWHRGSHCRTPIRYDEAELADFGKVCRKAIRCAPHRRAGLRAPPRLVRRSWSESTVDVSLCLCVRSRGLSRFLSRFDKTSSAVCVRSHVWAKEMVQSASVARVVDTKGGTRARRLRMAHWPSALHNRPSAGLEQEPLEIVARHKRDVCRCQRRQHCRDLIAFFLRLCTYVVSSSAPCTT